MSKISEITAKFEAMQKEVANQLQAAFKEMTKELFDSCPTLNAVVWAQYSPYFNDGEECVFGVHAPTFTNASVDIPSRDLAWGEYVGEEEGIWTYGDNCYGDVDVPMPKEYEDIVNAFDGALQSGSMEDIMRAMFGNHVLVTLTRDGATVDEYDHD